MLTVLGAMNHCGMLAAMTVEAATDREVFLAFLDDILCPKLRAGHVVVMDNLSAPRVDGVRQRIEACGASALYLPPYSPISLLSKRPGPNSSRACAQHRQEPSETSTPQSHSCSQPSRKKTQPDGSD